jgi:two-component system chemotaxis sensor kinase CheA
VRLELRSAGNRLTISVEDDGQGVDLAKVRETAVERGLLSAAEADAKSAGDMTRLLFQPGFSTASALTELSGRGIGLSIVYETVTRLQGEIDVRPREGGGTNFSMSVPLSIATHRLLLATARGQTFAIPSYGIDGLHRVHPREVETVVGQPMITLAGQLMPLTSLASLLDSAQAEVSLQSDLLALLVLRQGSRRLAVAVDTLLAERDSLIKPLGWPAAALSLYIGGVLLEDGGVALALNPAELIERHQPVNASQFLSRASAEAKRTPTILVVDDSFTTRTLETSILETHGYRVRVAVDGLEALTHLRSDKIDLVISDIQMPRLDGFGLLEEMKRDSRLARIPVIVVSSVDNQADQERGLRLGADAYIVKKKFDHQDLLKTIQQIL